MLCRSIATAIAVAIACVAFPRTDADARGGGFHGGMGAGFHMAGSHFGFQRGHPMMHGDMRRDMRGGRMHHNERDHRGKRAGNNRFARSAFGGWHRRSGFGNNAHSSLIADGQWHAGGAFR